MNRLLAFKENYFTHTLPSPKPRDKMTAQRSIRNIEDEFVELKMQLSENVIKKLKIKYTLHLPTEYKVYF